MLALNYWSVRAKYTEEHSIIQSFTHFQDEVKTMLSNCSKGFDLNAEGICDSVLSSFYMCNMASSLVFLYWGQKSFFSNLWYWNFGFFSKSSEISQMLTLEKQKFPNFRVKNEKICQKITLIVDCVTILLVYVKCLVFHVLL